MPTEDMIILDIDNCIADDEWRIPRIEWRFKNPMMRYHAYHALAPWDNCRNQRLFRDKKCLVLTARPLLYRVMTEEWLRRCGVQIKQLVMRNNNDHGSSLRIKTQQLQWLVNLYGVKLEEIEMAYDDRPEIVTMYREHGLQAEVRAIHNTTSYDSRG